MEVWEYRDHYEILEVARGATPEEVTRAYRLQMQAWAPDKMPPALEEIARKRTQRINAAYETLKSPDGRKDYDRQLPPEELELSVFPEPLQNVPAVWKRMAAWMKDEDVGTNFSRKMAFTAGDLVERRQVPTERQHPWMMKAWEEAVAEGFDPASDDDE
jgi:curved DNA-binding protein CbpA